MNASERFEKTSEDVLDTFDKATGNTLPPASRARWRGWLRYKRRVNRYAMHAPHRDKTLATRRAAAKRAKQARKDGRR